MSERVVFRWACLLVAAAALAAIVWILNDVRLQVRELAGKADTVLTHAERLTTQLDDKVPKILTQTERAAATMNQHLPALLDDAENAVANLDGLSSDFRQYRDLMGAVHGKPNKDLFAYASSVLDQIGGQQAAVGVKKSGSDRQLRQAVPAKTWANASRKDAHFLSLAAASKSEVLRGLARTDAAAPLYIQLGEQAPRLLGDWLRETHKESQNLP